MASEEVDRRIEAARQDAERQRQAKEFLESLKPGDSLAKPIYNPEAYIMRDKFAGAARRGDLAHTKCTHPFALIEQYLDDDPTAGRRGKPVNLFECGVCRTPLWLVDPWGVPVTDD